MTDGIIQHVIDKWNNEFINGDVTLDLLLIEIRKELIEKIKQTCDISDLDDDAYWVIRQIIGDVKE